MTNIYFWRGALGVQSFKGEHQEALQKLLNGTYASSDLEMLKGHHGIFSYRLNKGGRLLFTTIEVEKKRYLLLLEHLPTHDYQTSHFLRSGVLKRYLVNHEDAMQSAAWQFESVDVQPLAPDAHDEEGTTFKAIDYYQQTFIQLSEVQEEALGVPLPSIISGVAGSGKSCVATTLLSNFVAHHVEQESRIIYVTQSQRLVRPMEASWRGLPMAQAIPEHLQVEFKTYEELLFELGELEGKTLVDRAHFDGWFKAYKSLQNRNATLRNIPLFELDADTTYQEFRIVCAYDNEGYIALGARQSSLAKDVRELIVTAFTDYKKRLDDKALVNPAFQAITAQSLFDLIVVDEAQDLSHLELKNLERLAKNGAIACCIDTHQSLYDLQSKRVYLAELLRGADARAVSQIALPISYRCPLKIARAATAMIQAKYRLTGGAGDKHETPLIAPNLEGDADMGQVFVVDEKTMARSRWLKTQQESAHLAVVTTEEHMRNALQYFPRNRVFLPHEIKGLEYDTVLVFCPFSSQTFKEAYRRDADTKHQAAVFNRAKPGIGDNTFGPAFNETIVSLTRARKTLVLCDNVQLREVKHYLAPFYDIMGDSNLDEAEASRETTCQDWENEIIRLADLEQLDRAFDIYLLKINTKGTRPVFEDYLQQKRKKPEPIPISKYLPIAPPQTAPASPAMPITVTPSSTSPPERKKPEKRAATSALSKESAKIIKLLSYFSGEGIYPFLPLRKHKQYWFNTPVNFEGVQLTLIQHIFRSYERTRVFSLCLRIAFKDYESEDSQLILDVIKEQDEKKVIRADVQRRVLFTMLLCNPSIANDSYVSSWLKTAFILDSDPGNSLLYWLTADPAGSMALKYLLQLHDPDILIPTNAWSAEVTVKGHFCTPLELLVRSKPGMCYIVDLIDRFPEYVKKALPSRLWFVRNVLIERLSPIEILANTNAGISILGMLWEKFPELLCGVPVEIWACPEKQVGLLFNLTGSIVGPQLIKKLLDDPASTIHQISAEDWMGMSLHQVGFAKDSPLVRLTSFLGSASLLLKDQIADSMLFEYPTLIHKIPAAFWAHPLISLKIVENFVLKYPTVVDKWSPEDLCRSRNIGSVSYPSLISTLMSEKAGLAVIKHLLQKHQELMKKIPPNILGAHFMEIKEGVKNRTYLCVLVSSMEGCEMLLDLVTNYPEVIRAITPKTWGMQLEEDAREQCGCSPLSLLASSAAGCAILTNLRELLVAQPETIREIDRLLTEAPAARATLVASQGLFAVAEAVGATPQTPTENVQKYR